MKPRIAVTPRLSHENTRVGANTEYMTAILLAGGIPYMISLETPMEELLQDFDGLLITGGDDIYPDFYHEEVTCPIETSTREMDQFDFDCIQAFYQAKKPILGICRGIQSVNVAFGGTLYQDLPSQYSLMRVEGHMQHKMVPPLGRNDVAHKITTIPDTRLCALMGKEAWVNTYHHQNIKDLAPNFTVNAMSEDGLIEGIELEDQILCVQWHPERLTTRPEHLALFTDFIKKASQ